MTQIAFIGLGNLGYPMFQQLLAAGHELTVFDLVAQAVERASASGATAASSAADAVKNAEVVVTVLPEGRHARDVYLGEGRVIGTAPTSALLIDCSTIDVATAREVAGIAAQEGYRMVDAPVSGGVVGAEAGTLTFMVGGAEADFESARPVLGAMGKNLVHMGASGNGQVAKICNNMVSAIAMIGTSEAFSLGQSLGVAPEKLFNILSTSSGQTWSGDKMCPIPGIVPSAAVNRDFAPGFKAALMCKDLGLAESAARDTGVSTPLGAVAASLYRMLCKQDRGELDVSVIYKLIAGEP